MDFRLRKIFQKSGGFQLKLAVSMARFWGSFLHPAVVIGVVGGFQETYCKIGRAERCMPRRINGTRLPGGGKPYSPRVSQTNITSKDVPVPSVERCG